MRRPRRTEPLPRLLPLMMLLALAPPGPTRGATVPVTPAVMRTAPVPAGDTSDTPSPTSATMLYSQGDRVLVATWERSPSGRTRILFSSRGDELEIVSFLNRGTGWGEVGYRFPDGRRLDFVVSPGGEIVDGDPDALRAALDEPIGFLGLVHDFAGSDAARLRWTGAGTAVGVLPPYTSAEEGLPGWQRCTDQCAAGCPAQQAGVLIRVGCCF